MAGRHRKRMAYRVAAWLGLSVCALALAATPLLRHDPQCHLQSSGHCDACMANPVALCAGEQAGLDSFHLRDAGQVETSRRVAVEPIFVVEGPSRSPPA